jgi:pheromone shutdown protein TraB
MKREDLASAEEVMRGDFAPAVDTAVVTSRDAKLVAVIDSMIVSTNTPTTVGIVYGAGHMQVVTAALMEKHHYRVNSSEWLTVFDYADA